MFKLQKKKVNQNNDDILFLDVTPRSVKALYGTSGEAKLIIKGVAMAEQKPAIEENILETAINEAFAQSGSTTTNGVVGIGGPNVFGFLLIVKIKRKDPTKRINEKEMDQVYARIKETAMAQALQMKSVLFAEESELETLDLVVTNFSIDDKHIGDPIDLTGEYLQISTFNSYSDINYYNTLVSALKDHKIKPLAVTTTLYSQVKLLSQSSKNFLLIDIGKTYTDIAVVFGKNIVQTRSFDIGGDFFTNYLVDKLGLPPKDAAGKKEAFAMGTLPPESADEIGDLLYEAGKSWRMGLAGVLESMSGIKSFPKKIFITGGTSQMPIIQELLYEEEWKNSLPFVGEMEISLPDTTILDEYLVDDLKILSGARMFIPASLIGIFNELDKDESI